MLLAFSRAAALPSARSLAMSGLGALSRVLSRELLGLEDSIDGRGAGAEGVALAGAFDGEAGVATGAREGTSLDEDELGEGVYRGDSSRERFTSLADGARSMRGSGRKSGRASLRERSTCIGCSGCSMRGAGTGAGVRGAGADRTSGTTADGVRGAGVERTSGTTGTGGAGGVEGTGATRGETFGRSFAPSAERLLESELPGNGRLSTRRSSRSLRASRSPNPPRSTGATIRLSGSCGTLRVPESVPEGVPDGVPEGETEGVTGRT